MDSVSRINIIHDRQKGKILYFFGLRISDAAKSRLLNVSQEEQVVAEVFDLDPDTEDKKASFFIFENVDSFLSGCVRLESMVKEVLPENIYDPIYAIPCFAEAHKSSPALPIDLNIWRQLHKIQVWNFTGTNIVASKSVVSFPKPMLNAGEYFGRFPSLMEMLQVEDLVEPPALVSQAWSALVEKRNVALITPMDNLTVLCIVPYVISRAALAMENPNELIKVEVLLMCEKGTVRKAFADSLSKWNTIGAKICVLGDGNGKRMGIESVSKGVHVLVTSPYRVRALIQNGILQMNQVRHIVVCDFNKIFRESYSKCLRFILENITVDVQLVVCIFQWFEWCTEFFKMLVPKSIPFMMIKECYGSKRRYFIQNVEIVKRSQRFAKLLNTLESYPVKKVIVCAKDSEKAVSLAMQLSYCNYNCVTIHENLSYTERSKRTMAFIYAHVVVLVVSEDVLKFTVTPACDLVINYSSPRSLHNYLELGSRLNDNGEMMTFTESFKFINRLALMHKTSYLKMHVL